MKDLRHMINYLATVDGWHNVSADIGHTGYLDSFGKNEVNGYGCDEAGRAFVQVRVMIEDKEETLRVFERYEDDHKLLVACGSGKGLNVFPASFSFDEWRKFVKLVLYNVGFENADIQVDAIGEPVLQ